MDRGGAFLEYAAIVVLVAALVAAVAVRGPVERLSEAFGSAVDGVLDGATSGQEPPVDGDWDPDPQEAAEAVKRCLEGDVAVDPVGRVDCALALLGLLESDVLEATVLQLTAEELHELFANRTFTATGAARTAVRLLWDHASDETLRRLAETRTFGFLEPALDSPRAQFTLRFVNVSQEYVRARIEQKAT